VPEIRCCHRGGKDGEREKIKIGDSFKLVYRFTSQLDPAYNVPMDDFDVRIKYYTKYRDGSYEVVKQGTTLVNCIVLWDKSILKAIFDDYKLEAGELWMDVIIESYDFEYPDRRSKHTYTLDTGITLID